MSEKPWAAYRVAAPDAKAQFQNERTPFQTISHTCHVDAAIEIIKLGKVRPGLVFDKSKLNRKRILVSWASPNDWSTLGYRYGNIRFDFDFEAIIKDRQAYWVECIDSYSPAAPRILITDRDRGRKLKKYDPSDAGGPWFRDSSGKANYFNSKFTLEFMVEGALEMSHVKSISFVKHHSTWCSASSQDPSSCDYLGKSQDFGGSRFVARCAASRVSLQAYAHSFVFSETGKPKPNLAYATALNEVMESLNNPRRKFCNAIQAKRSHTTAVARAILGAYSYGNTGEARTLASLFKDMETCEAAIAEVFCSVIGWKDYRAILPGR
ncbi:hypothetical protein [uncultured Stenotrophomonas sp.]|uniref:hypothetical protein n=1 Tax=uncultured Stenotrophomonas sp. TaxID=165438 RepID=UPI0025F7F023|nr:hypothetical protein [uncultured Stenotrophomonas sp.]